MGKRNQAREEAAFHRGDVGVDGQATEEKRDEAEVERGKATEQYLRGKAYLGREFLTWLLWRSESGDTLLEHDGEPLTVVFDGRIVLKGIAGEVTELIARGTMAPYSALVKESLERGLLIHSARPKLTHGEKTYEVTLDAEFLDVRAAKLPELLSEEADDQMTERLYLTERLSALLEALVSEFLKVRSTKRWSRTVVPAMKEWLADRGGDTEKKVKRAAAR